MEAMVIQGDNTATGMILKEASADAVRRFIASIELRRTMIPDSMRVFAAYLSGAPNYKTITWNELISIPPSPLVYPFFNNAQTLASSPDDLVSFFLVPCKVLSSVIRKPILSSGEFLSLGDINYLGPFPYGLSVFGKAGCGHLRTARTINCRSVYFPDRWIYFSVKTRRTQV